MFIWGNRQRAKACSPLSKSPSLTWSTGRHMEWVVASVASVAQKDRRKMKYIVKMKNLKNNLGNWATCYSSQFAKLHCAALLHTSFHLKQRPANRVVSSDVEPLAWPMTDNTGWQILHKQVQDTSCHAVMGVKVQQLAIAWEISPLTTDHALIAGLCLRRPWSPERQTLHHIGRSRSTWKPRNKMMLDDW